MSGIGGVGGGSPPIPDYDSTDGADGYDSPPEPAPTPGAGATGSPGIMLFAPNLSLPLGDYHTQASRGVETRGQTAIDALEGAAERNTTGPEARLSEKIKGSMDGALRAIRADEQRARALPLGSPEREAIEKRFDDRTRLFDHDLAVATLKCADEIKSHSGGDKGALDRFKSMLPGYLRECVDRGGVVVPGVPGSFRPRTDDGTFGGPTGLDFKMPWG